MWDEKQSNLNTSVYSFYVCNVNFVVFVFQTNKFTIYVHNILYVISTRT